LYGTWFPTDDPTVFKEAFGRLVSWVAGSLDLYRHELSSILYPVFIHMFLNLHEQV
jgi:transcription initiation factor TFIID subunit 5